MDFYERPLKIEHFAKVSMDITGKLHKIGSILYADAFKTTLKQNCFLIFAFFSIPLAIIWWRTPEASIRNFLGVLTNQIACQVETVKLIS